MLRVELTFPSGRYHATPWGRHVNEEQVEWPPSPWRIARALLAVGHTRLGWRELPAVAASLLSKLASTAPNYALPPATVVPHAGQTAKSREVFLQVGRAPLGIEYDVELSVDERILAGELFVRLPYLGRVESSVLAHVVEALSVPVNCRPLSTATAGGVDLVDVLVADRPSALAHWRARALEEAWQSRLDQRRSEAKARGKLEPVSLGRADKAKVAALFPASLTEALQMDTALVQQRGWSTPPGSRWVRYAREGLPLCEERSTQAAANTLPTTAVFALSAASGRVGVEEALRRMEMLHAALVSASDPTKTGQGSLVLTGQDAHGERLRGHRHASLLPLSLVAGPGCIDHVLVHAPMGFDARARAALSTVRKTYAKGMAGVYVKLLGLGREDDFSAEIPEVRTATQWLSSTPFVPPRYAKPRGSNSLLGQVQSELALRGFPAAAEVAVELADGSFVPLHTWQEQRSQALSTRFRNVQRERRDRRPPTRLALGLRLTFAEPVRGPISLGYASHFGLGAFRPADSSGSRQ